VFIFTLIFADVIIATLNGGASPDLGGVIPA
jgi:hypothetical protein